MNKIKKIKKKKHIDKHLSLNLKDNATLESQKDHYLENFKVNSHLSSFEP